MIYTFISFIFWSIIFKSVNNILEIYFKVNLGYKDIYYLNILQKQTFTAFFVMLYNTKQTNLNHKRTFAQCLSQHIVKNAVIVSYPSRSI